MVSRQRLPNALQYSLRFSYPLDDHELWYWQVETKHPKSYFHSPRYSSKLLNLKKQRFLFSQNKWQIAKRVGRWLSKIPTIQAIFVTGSLAMNNCPVDDDIDFFVVTAPNTLWLTRLFVVLLLTLKNLRRPPYLSEHSSARVSNKICDNLYLDSGHLKISPQNLYLAHEILQAKPLFDKSGIQHQLLTTNYWSKVYLPIAFSETIKKLKPSKDINNNFILNTFYLILNTLFFIPQYLYMLPFKTTEKISLGSAFFHPRKQNHPNF